jgi:hypothetical protein
MTFDLSQAFTERKPRSLDHLPWTRRLSRLTGSWKVFFLECLQGVILRNGMRHLETARWHKDLVLKREKQADHIGMRAAAVLARAKDGNDKTL